MSIEAMKQALEQIVNSAEFKIGNPAFEQKEAILRQAIEQAQKQEPVACVQDLDEVKRKHLVYEKGMDWKDPLYTSPPQRQWVGLTDEDWQDLSDRHRLIIWGSFKRDLEAKLKQKNGYAEENT